MPSHVCGGSSIKSARYQSNWVLVVIGAAYSLSCHLAVFSGPGSVLARGVGLGLARRIVGQRQSPTRLGELGGPHHVERHHVERLVVAGEPASQLQALIVGTLRQADLLDGEAAAEFFVAPLGDCGEGGHLVSRGVVVDDDPAAAANHTPTPLTPSSAQPMPQPQPPSAHHARLQCPRGEPPAGKPYCELGVICNTLGARVAHRDSIAGGHLPRYHRRASVTRTSGTVRSSSAPADPGRVRRSADRTARRSGRRPVASSS